MLIHTMEVFNFIRGLIGVISLIGLIIFGLNKLTFSDEKLTSKFISGTGILCGIEIVVQIVGNFISFNGISVNLSLIPIAVGAILFGPFAGAILGFLNGVIVLLSPSTLAVFVPCNPLGTVIVCLFKCTFAGFFAGLIYKIIKNRNVGVIISSLLIPIINTLLFSIGSLIFFKDILNSSSNTFPNVFAFLIFGMIGWNFVLELLTTALLSPAISKIIKYSKGNN